jgi:hypothetical protein
MCDDTLTRFWSKVDIRGPDECWRWTGAGAPGYGKFKAGKKDQAAHRFSWELAHAEEIPPGMVVRHTCDHPWCVNPDHLVIGTTADNNRDAVRRDRQAKGRQIGVSRLDPDAVREIRRLRREQHLSGMVLGRMFGVSDTTIYQIVRYRTWAWVE